MLWLILLMVLETRPASALIRDVSLTASEPIVDLLATSLDARSVKWTALDVPLFGWEPEGSLQLQVVVQVS